MKKFLTATVAALLLSVGVTTPAQATYNDCAGYPGTVCFHEYPNFTGRVWRQYPSQINGCRNLAPDNFDNKASTAFNNSYHHVMFVWQYPDCTGAYISIGSAGYLVFTGTEAWWNDKASSIEVIPL